MAEYNSGAIYLGGDRSTNADGLLILNGPGPINLQPGHVELLSRGIEPSPSDRVPVLGLTTNREQELVQPWAQTRESVTYPVYFSRHPAENLNSGLIESQPAREKWYLERIHELGKRATSYFKHAATDPAVLTDMLKEIGDNPDDNILIYYPYTQ